MTSFETIRNPIFRLYWAGWEADTLRLQREGWQISMEQEVHYCRMRVAIKHPQFQMYGLSRSIEFDFMGYGSPHGYIQQMREFPVIAIDKMASNFTVTMIADMSTFQPVSAVPEFSMMERKHIDDFKIFKPLDQVKEIIIARPNVKELLDQIIAQQDPKQAELRDKRRKELRKIGRALEGMRPEDIEIIKPDEELVAQIVAVA
jgi:hypothetical protein